MELRPLDGWEEYRACEAMQRRVWGEDFSETAPASLLKIGQRLGGVSSGAFDSDEGLVGFVFGLTGVRGGRPVHWSHMLAVRPGFRDAGLGRRLKEHQRELVRERGVRTMRWSYDPLVARNAHFNLNRLGVRVEAYVPQMYGETGSRLHRGLGTDRFVVAWDLEAHEPGEDADAPGAEAGGPAPGRIDGEPADAVPDGLPGGAGLSPDASPPVGEEGPGRPPVVRVEVPSDIHRVREDDPEAAAGWRERTREAFLSRLESGYRVVGFVPGPERGFYVLAREELDGVRAPDDPDAAP